MKARNDHELIGLHGRARRVAYQRLRRANFVRAGRTIMGTVRKTYRKWPQLAPHKPRSKEYNRCYRRLKRSLAADSRLGVMVRGFERGGTLSGKLTERRARSDAPYLGIKR